MDWEVFYRVTLIFTSLTELKFKKQGNCDIMIMGPVDHRLNVILPHDLTCDSSSSSFNLHRFRYELFFTLFHCRFNLIPLIPTWLPISTSSFLSRSPMHRIWAKQIVWFDPRLMKKDYLQTKAFPKLVVVKWRVYSHVLLKKATGKKTTSKVVKVTVGWMRPGMTLETSTLASTINHTTCWVGLTAK